MWTKLFYLVLSLGLIWYLIFFMRHNPRAFSRDNLSKSFFSMGILALILIAFVAVCVYWLRFMH